MLWQKLFIIYLIILFVGGIYLICTVRENPDTGTVSKKSWVKMFIWLFLWFPIIMGFIITTKIIV